jgi:hypothetical protein
MESQGGRSQSQNKLQSALVQDQAVQSAATLERLNIEAELKNSRPADKVVIQFGNAVIKGYLKTPEGESVEDLLHNAPKSAPESLRIHRLDTNEVEDIEMRNAKAVFYVNTFEGDAQHTPLQFHLRAPMIHGIWVRIDFRDGEVIEGIVHNSIRYLVDEGFFVIPTDPGSNNKLIYVLKSSIKDYRVLGMRHL